MNISVIIPVLNEACSIQSFLKDHQWMRQAGHEIIVVDGGSVDQTAELTKNLCDQLLYSKKGRALQMNSGASAANGSALLFLHADTELPANADQLIIDALSNDKKAWGRFDVKLSGNSLWFRIIERMMNLRSRITGIATGDQAIFVRAETFSQLNGFENIPLMEDISLTKRLKKVSFPICLRSKVITSSRRWEDNGVWKTIFLMWKLRFAYYLGQDPNVLVRKYYR